MNTSRPLLPAMSPHRRLGAGALAVGTGAWALHLLGLQALLLSQAQSHSIGLTLLSWLTAVLGSAAVLSSWQAPPEHWWRHAAALLGGGLGYGGMHFIGLAAMPLPPELQASVQGDASLTAGTLAALVAAGLVQLTSHWLLESVPPSAPDTTSHDLLVQATTQLQQIAQRDPLTGLANRPAFEIALRQAAERSRLHRSEFAVLCIDISRLQLINESYGQHGGDEVLRDIATRLKSCCRSGDLVARAGGDEFLLLIEAPQLRTDRLIERARSLIETLSVPLELCSGQEVQIGCSIGIAMHPLHGPAERLVAAADTATHTARRLGSNQICVFENRMHDELRQELDLLRELTQALEHDGLTLWYQPKIGCASQHVTGCEALVRWPHPQRGMIGPNVFIPLAERHGLICRLGDWITEQACRQVRQWLDQGLCFRVAINLSVHQLEQPGLVAHIRASIERHRIDPALLCFEITESVAMENVQKSLAIFHELRALGVQLSIDDFGTGYSSLSYLSRLPVQQLKIDRSFVRELDAGNNHHGRTIVDMVIRLGQTLGMKVVAEGVETDAQRQALVELGCDELQGFLYAKPMPADALTRWAIGIDRPARVQFPASIYVTATAPAEAVPTVAG